MKKEQKLKQKKSLAWKERQGLQRKEQATKQKKCVSQSLLKLHACLIDTPDMGSEHLLLQLTVSCGNNQAGRQPEGADGYQAAEQEGQAREEADASRI